jgi:hypothetical protein
MTTINNKTRKPLSIPLPRGKTLHLSPGKSGQIAAKDAEHPALKKLVEAGEIEVVDDGPRSSGGGDGGGRGGTPMQGYGSSSSSRRSGDR